MVGIADYNNTATNTLPVVLKLETNTPDDYFIAFNRAAGVNSQNDQADDELTIITTGNNGGAQSQSYLKATLSQDESYIIKDFGGTGKDIIVHLCEIDMSSSFNGAWVARISLSRSEAGVRCPTNSVRCLHISRCLCGAHIYLHTTSLLSMCLSPKHSYLPPLYYPPC